MQKIKFFVFMSLKIWMIKKEPHTTFVQYFLFTAVDITIYQQFNLEHVQGCGCDLKQRFLSIDVSFRHIIRSSQKDLCLGRGFRSYHPVYFHHSD